MCVCICFEVALMVLWFHSDCDIDVSLKSTPTLLLHTHLVITLVSLVVEISVSYTPPPGFTPGPNEYRAASGPVVVTCTATGGSGSGDYQYVWTSTCSGCIFRRTSTGVTSVLSRTFLHSGDIGTHTCTASRGGDSASASIVFNVVGEWLLLQLTVCAYLRFFSCVAFPSIVVSYAIDILRICYAADK